jgi:hypothetical protein
LATKILILSNADQLNQAQQAYPQVLREQLSATDIVSARHTLIIII